MSSHSRQSRRINRGFLDFIETEQYNALTTSHPILTSTQATLPRSWRQFQHPIGDIYFHNPNFRITTAEDIRNPQILHYILDAREDHMQSIASDPNYSRLPPDIELVISDVSDTTAVIRMFSRLAGSVYHYSDSSGLRIGSKEEFWSHIAEFPSHHRDLPQNAESNFTQSLRNAKIAIANGSSQFCFTEGQIDKIISRYQDLAGLRAQGRDVTASLAWLIGVVMPLEPISRQFGGHNVDHILRR